MNKRVNIVLAITVLMGFSLTAIFAQSGSITKELEKIGDGGYVKVYQSPELESILFCDTLTIEDRMVSGYRIQIYSDNMQRKARETAQARAKMIQQADSTLDTYITFNSPFWRVRVGNYASYEEAAVKLRQLKKQFPSIPDMRIVKDIIVEK